MPTNRKRRTRGRRVIEPPLQALLRQHGPDVTEADVRDACGDDAGVDVWLALGELRGLPASDTYRGLPAALDGWDVDEVTDALDAVLEALVARVTTTAARRQARRSGPDLTGGHP